MDNNTTEVVTLLRGMDSVMSILQQGVELKAQTSRLRNILSATDIDETMGQAVVSLRRLTVRLKNALKEDAQ